MNFKDIILLVFLFVNIFSFVLYYVDKRKAIQHKYRISEFTLILVSVLGGSIGAYLAMIFAHHKTKHKKFTITVPICVIVHIALLCYFVLDFKFVY